MDTSLLIDDKRWKSDFARFIREITMLGAQWRGMPVSIQNIAAEIIAEQYRRFLRGDHLSPELRPLTQILQGEHAPLVGLADHVIVRKTINPDKSALVTWEKGWAKIALMHDRGYYIIVTEKQRDAMFRFALLAGANRSDFIDTSHMLPGSSKSYWEVPARPHAFFLGSPAMEKILKIVAEGVMAGGLQRLGVASAVMTKSVRPIYPEWRRMSFTNAEWIGDSGGELDDLDSFGDS